MKLKEVRDSVKSTISVERARSIKKRIETMYRLMKLPIIVTIILYTTLSLEGPMANRDAEYIKGFVTGTYGNTIYFSDDYEINKGLPDRVELSQEDSDKASVRMYVEMEKTLSGRYSIINTRQTWEDAYESNQK